MAKFYETQLRLGKIKLDDVPLKWKEEVIRRMQNTLKNS